MVKGEIHKHYNRLLANNKFISADTVKNSYLGLGEHQRSLIETFQYHNDKIKELIGVDVVKATHTKLVTTQIYAQVLEHKVSEGMNELRQKLQSL